MGYSPALCLPSTGSGRSEIQVKPKNKCMKKLLTWIIAQFSETSIRHVTICPIGIIDGYGLTSRGKPMPFRDLPLKGILDELLKHALILQMRPVEFPDEEIGGTHRQEKDQARSEDGAIGHALAVRCENQGDRGPRSSFRHSGEACERVIVGAASSRDMGR